MSKTPAQRVEKINREISGVAAQFDVDSWEQAFMSDVSKLFGLSPKQEAQLREIEIKVFGDAFDPHTGDLFS